MAGGFSTFLANDIINHYLRGGSPVYASLHTQSPTAAAGPGEVSTSGTGYVRKAVTFGAPTAGVASNNALVAYDVAETDWGDLTHFGVWDAASGGNLLWEGPLTTPKPMTSGDTFKFNTGQLTCSAIPAST